MLKKPVSLAASALMYTMVLLISTTAVEARTDVATSVQNIRYWSTREYTRAIIELDVDAPYENARLTSPDRVYFDISNARLGSDLLNRTILVGDEFLKRVRVAQNRSDVVRVVLDISPLCNYSISELHNPFRIVVDLYGQPGTGRGINPLPQASTPRPDETGQKTALRQVSGVGKQVEKVPMPSTQHEVIRVTSAVQPVEPMTQPAPPAVTESTPAPPEEVEPSPESSPADDVTTEPAPDNLVDAKTPKPPVQSKAREAGSAPSQERPLSITGTLYTGFYASSTRGGSNENQSISFVPGGGTFDINGYYMTPDLVDYWVQPEFSAGAQASDAGFVGGNGVRTRIAFLKRRAFPLTFRYSNVQLKDVYFGSLSQLSSYSTNNRNEELGLTGELKHAGLPAVTMDWGNNSVDSKSDIAMVPDYHSHSNHLNLNWTYQRWGWDFRGFALRQQQVSDLFAFVEEGSNTSVLRQQVVQYQASARRSFLQDSELYMDAGSQSTASLLLNQDIDLNTRYANANLRLFQRRRWKTSLRAGYTSNVAGLLLTRFVGGLGSNGSVAPEPGLLSSFQHTTSYLNLNALTSFDLSHGFSLYSSIDRTAVSSPEDSSLSSRYLTMASGMTYSGTFRWGSLSGQYGHSLGIGSVTKQTGRFEGQNYVVTAQPGRGEGLRFDFTVRGTDQRVHDVQPAEDHSLATDAGVGLGIFGRLRARVGGGWQWGTFKNGGSDFHTNGYTARAGIEHPRFQLNGSLSSILGNSFQSYSQMLGGIILESALLGPMRLVPSDLRGLTLSMHVIPTRKLELSGLWTRSIQHLEGVVVNDFEIIDVYLTYHFRRLQVVAGFFSSGQIYTSYLATYPETKRVRYYIRISRPVKFL